MMKKRIVLAFLASFLAIVVQAQKFAYIDTEYIFKNMPEYQEAQKQLDELSEQWLKQVEKKYKAIEKLQKDFQAEEILLTESMKNRRQEEILKKEAEAREFQKKKFGVDGELFKKRKELIKPIQEKIYKAVQETANVGKYSVIFDKASEATMVYSNPKYDKSDDVLKRMGIRPGGKNK